MDLGSVCAGGRSGYPQALYQRIGHCASAAAVGKQPRLDRRVRGSGVEM